MASFTDSKRYPQEVVDALALAGFVYRPSISSEVNTHPKLAAARAGLEAQACNGRALIWDVGGHRQRHELNNRVVHCTQPKRALQDLRSGDCECTAGTCDCVWDFNVIIMVHTAYHLTEDEIWRLAEKAQLKGCPLYSVEHAFSVKDGCGTIDEAKYSLYYSVDDQLMVKFVADETYDHCLPSWFLREKVLAIRGGECLVRNYKNSLFGTFLNSYAIVPVSSLASPPVPLMRHEIPEWWNVIPGVFSIKLMRPSPFLFTDVRGGVQADFSQSSAYTAFCEGFPVLGKIAHRLWPCTPSQIAPVHLPEKLVRYLQNGIGSTKEDFDKLRNDARAWTRQNEGLVPKGISLEYVKEVAIHAAYGQDRRLITAISSVACFHSYFDALCVGAVAYTALWGLARYVLLRYWYRDPRSRLRLLLTVCKLPVIFLLLPFVKRYGADIISRVWRYFNAEAHRFVNQEVKLQMKQTTLSIAELIPLAVPGSVLEKVAPTTPTLRYYQRILPSFNGLEVQVFNTSSHNTECAVVGRFLKAKPQFNPQVWAAFHVWFEALTSQDFVSGHYARRMQVDQDGNYVLEGREPFVPTPNEQTFDEWILSRPLSKQRKNYTRALRLLLDQAKRNAPAEVRGAYDTYAANLKVDTLGNCEVLPHMISSPDLARVNGWRTKKAFVKVEKTFKAGKLPRVIVAASDAFQVFCGPAVHGFDHTLVEWFRWCSRRIADPTVRAQLRNLPRVHFTVGWTQAKLSRSFNNAFTRARVWDGELNTWYACVTVYVLGDDNLTVFPTANGVRCMANDFSSFDTTHSENSWRIQEVLMTVCGVRRDVVRVLADTTRDIHLTSIKHGGKFRASWNMCSGNPNTCNGNSAIGGSVGQYQVYLNQDAFLREDVSPIEQTYCDLGFEPKVHIGSVQSVDYLSGIFLQDDRGTFYWIPKVFRLAVKQCYVADPRTDLSVSDYQNAFVDSYKHFRSVPVIRSLLALFQRIAGPRREGKIKAIHDNDRNYWYGPQHDAVTVGDIDVDFCRHYDLTAYSLGQLERMIENWDTNFWKEIPDFTRCFLQDVPDYVA